MRELTIDLNADVGEGAGEAAGAAPLYSIVTSVNIACGVHAGDEATMRRSVERALEHTVAIGAHPGYDDREHMGRRSLTLAPYDVERLVVAQIRTLQRIVTAAGGRLGHVKPHGALYNQAAVDATLARAVAAAVAAVDPALTLVGLAGGQMIDAGRAAGLAVASEVFCDRGYRADGTLIPRDEPGALIEDPAAVAAQAVAFARPIVTPTSDGHDGNTRLADTICVHADSPGALERAAAVRSALESAGVAVRRFSS